MFRYHNLDIIKVTSDESKRSSNRIPQCSHVPLQEKAKEKDISTSTCSLPAIIQYKEPSVSNQVCLSGNIPSPVGTNSAFPVHTWRHLLLRLERYFYFFMQTLKRDPLLCISSLGLGRGISTH